MRSLCLALLLVSPIAFADAPVEDKGTLKSTLLPSAWYEFGGVLGERLKANADNWILPTPAANPGMLEMFRMRDRKPVPQLVPWAGEFAGKYLISAVMALKASDDEALRTHVADFVRDLIATQSPEGYIGPFPTERRLLGEWDLWGHYHVILGLLDWHEFSGDAEALASAQRAGDFICSVYLNTSRRPIEAGSDEMNLSIVHGLARLYRVTGEQRYLDMARLAEEDWQKGGDYFRQGLANVPFYKTPRPRWESLHDLQGLTELYRITGNEEYKTAFVNLWRSIRDRDRHNTGGFTTGEQAIGEPYTEGAIETCCTTAWSALCQDMLMLTGDAEAADELELALYNSVIGSQHPSGRWCTYNTPMNGKREASAHTIVFQARAGTPELNCCSVNGPRGLAMPVEWALMRGEDGALVVNYLGPMQAEVQMDGEDWQVKVDGDYLATGKVNVRVDAGGSGEKKVRIRMPRWCRESDFSGDGDITDRTSRIVDGYREVEFPAGPEREYRFEFEMKPHFWIGDGAQLGKVSVYYGPLLLAFDQRDNTLDCGELGELDFENIALEPVQLSGPFSPVVAFRLRTADGDDLILRDFATAGATGTEYRSWLPVRHAPPAGFLLDSPADGTHVSTQGVAFQWSGSPRPEGWHYLVELSETADFAEVQQSPPTTVPSLFWPVTIDAGKTYYWRVRSVNPFGEMLNTDAPRSIVVDAALPPMGPESMSLVLHRADGLIAGDPLDGEPKPDYGVFDIARGNTPADDQHGNKEGAIQLVKGGLLRYKTAGFPSKDYSVSLWARPDNLNPGRLSQLFSAWCRGADDPLRVCLDKGKLHARIEGMGGGSTQGVELMAGQWSHIAAVKQGGTLTLYVNGEEAARGGVPGVVVSAAKDVAIGGNPHHSADESFEGAVDDFQLWAHALSAEQIRALAAK